MGFSQFLRRAASIAAGLLMLGGCSGNGLVNAPSVGGSALSAAAPLSAERNARGPLVYISDTLGNFIDVFARNGTLAGRIVDGLDGPAELFVDADHNLWVANSGKNEVLEFRRGAMKAASSYRDVSNAMDPAMCSSGSLYVSDFTGSIAVFASGHHRPTGSLSENYGVVNSVACDPAGNIFATTTVLSPPGDVIEFPAGSKQAKRLPIILANPTDAKPDPAGNLLVLDSAGDSYNTVTEYTEAGSPTGKSMPTGANWIEMAVSPNGEEIFGADINDLEGSLRSFPSGTQIRTYTDSRFKQLGGIAYDPG
jgi:DNA-binding beta-propeller fold protein YncE